MEKMEKKPTTVNNAQVKVAKVEQTADKEFGIEAKTMYYLLVVTDKGQKRLNVGKDTYETVKELLK